MAVTSCSRVRARLIFLAYAEHRFDRVRPEIEAQATAGRSSGPDDYRAGSVLFVPDEARLLHLVALEEGTDRGVRSTRPWGAVAAHNPELRDVLRTGYQRLEKSTPIELLRLYASAPLGLSVEAATPARSPTPERPLPHGAKRSAESGVDAKARSRLGRARG